jgi:hypothetical protein
MDRWTPTQEEMKKRIARFNEVVPVKKKHLEDKGIPPEVLEMIMAKTTRNMMSPGPLPGQLSPGWASPPARRGRARACMFTTTPMRRSWP